MPSVLSSGGWPSRRTSSPEFDRGRRRAYGPRVRDELDDHLRLVVADSDDAWVARFAEHHRRLADALGARALSIEHIGSTAVPGLPAKPIVDVLVTVEDPDDEGAYLPALVAAGYELRVREPGHRM